MYPNRHLLQTGDPLHLIDTHCHLDCDSLRLRLDEVMSDARQAGVIGCIVPGVQPGNWGRISSLPREQAGVMIFSAFGIHPMHADLADDENLDRLAEVAVSGIAIGEIGLDPAYAVPQQLQERAFREQLRLGVRQGLPVLVHCRRAFLRTLQILREEKADHVGGIMHAFSGSPEMAREFIRLGFLISLSGNLTWDRAVRPVRLARELPLDSLVLETDAPDLTPQAFRGAPNQPAWLREVLNAVAAIRGTAVNEVARASVANARRILSRMVL